MTKTDPLGFAQTDSFDNLQVKFADSWRGSLTLHQHLFLIFQVSERLGLNPGCLLCVDGWCDTTSSLSWPELHAKMRASGRQQFKPSDFYYSLCSRAVIRYKLFLPQEEKKKPFWLRFPYTPKPNEQNGFHLPALATLPCSTCFPLCCGFSRHYHPLLSLLLLHQSIPQTDNLTCSAFHGVHVLSPSALCGLTAQWLANVVLAWPWNGKVRSATLLIFTHKHTCTFIPHNHTCMCIDCVHTLRRKHTGCSWHKTHLSTEISRLNQAWHLWR